MADGESGYVAPCLAARRLRLHGVAVYTCAGSAWTPGGACSRWAWTARSFQGHSVWPLIQKAGHAGDQRGQARK